jgi:hypothetical protein
VFMSAASGRARPTLSKSISATVCANEEVAENVINAAAASRKASFLMVVSSCRACR